MAEAAVPRAEGRMDAARAGRRHYLRAKPCGSCGDSIFYTSTGKCVACTNRRAREWQRKVADTLRGSLAAGEAG
jgi:ribosomal protein L37E